MSVIGSISNFLSGGEQDRARKLLEQGVNELRSVGVPDVEAQRIVLQRLVEAGQISPEAAQAATVQGNAYDDIKEDPSLRAAQLQALRQLQDVSSQGGLTAQDRSQLAQIQDQEATAERGSREAILQNAQARGVGGSGLELAQQLAAQQGSAQRRSTRDLDVAAMAQQRALEAMQQAGQLGGNVRSQDFNQESQRAQARNMINQFNASQTQGVNLQNVNARNNAQAANLANKQNIMNQNVGLANAQNASNASLAQQDYENRLRKAQSIASAAAGQAQQAQNAGQTNANTAFGLANAAVGIGNQIFGGTKEKK